MIFAVSPYHLTTRETPALVALLLADEVVTLVPSPPGDAPDQPAHVAAHQASLRSPSFAQFGKAWSWSAPLWRDGILLSHLEGLTPLQEFERVTSLIRADERFSPLRALMRDEADAGVFLDSIARDLLKGGPDPSFSVPVAAALDRFAARQAIFVLRSGPHSVAQKAEQALARPLFSVALPVLVQADAERILHARAVLHSSRRTLSEALQQVPLLVRDDGTLAQGLARSLVDVCETYARDFAHQRDEILRDCKDDEVRAIEGVVVVNAMALPSDAVLRSSVQAMAALSGRTRGTPKPAATTLPAIFDAVEGRWLATMLVKPLGSPRRR